MASPALDIKDYAPFATNQEKEEHSIYLMIENMTCASCAWQIENALNKENDVSARVNVTARRLAINWKGGLERCNQLIEKTAKLGFRLIPYDAANVEKAEEEEEKEEFDDEEDEESDDNE